MEDKLEQYIKVWWLLSKRAAAASLESKFGAAFLVAGKLFRFGFFLFFLFILLSRTKTLAGYSLTQATLIYATFNLIDVIPQFFFREVYRFRTFVVNGEFDYYLVKPISPLFRSLLGGNDILDFPMFVFSMLFIMYLLFKLHSITVESVLFYVLLVVNGVLIATAFHIVVLSLGILTTEVDNTLWIYRDLTSMGRFPVDIYRMPLSIILTFIVPIGIMITFPVKAVSGLLSIPIILAAFCIGLLAFVLSILLWNYSLRSYSSAG